MRANNHKPRLMLLVSHPVQHFCPMYAHWAKSEDWDFRVLFASAMGAKTYQDKDFGESIAWGNLYLEEFDHRFLNGGQVVQVGPQIDAPELIQELEAYAPDAIVVYGYSQTFQKKAVKWAKNGGKKVFYISDSERAHYEPSWKWMIKRWLYTPFFRQIDCCLTVGNHNEHYYNWMGVPLQKMIRLGFSIDIRFYEAAFSQKDDLARGIRMKYSIPDDHIVVSVVGKLISRKRQIELVKALKHLESTSQKRFTALIVGSGPDQHVIEREASTLSQNKAIITGFISPEQLVAYYAVSDIYAHVSEHDPHTLAVGEAIYMGCPIVLSDRCGVHGPTDDVQFGHNGLVYPCGQIDAMAQAIKRLGEDTEMRVQFGRNSREFALQSQNRAHFTGIRSALLAAGFDL